MIKHLSIADFKTKQGEACSHIISLGSGQVVHWYGYEGMDQKVNDKCESHYKIKHGLDYKVYKNIFK